MSKPNLPQPRNASGQGQGVSGRPTDAGKASADAPVPRPTSLPEKILVAAALGATFAWAYWPTLVELVRTWNTVADYSHGYLVPPFAALFLWLRREEFPGLGRGFAWGGAVLIVVSLLVRAAGAAAFVGGVDGWSMLFWFAGVFWLFGGWKVCRWALPAIGFLFFMVPLPFRVEHWLSWPLQRVATQMSCWVLQFLGQPALAQGNVILLGSHELEVAQACSGLRIFVGILAVAWGCLILIRWSWWERVLLLLSVIPVALVANSTRIVVTALLQQLVSGEAAERFTHDVSGFAMIPFAAVLFALVPWYLGRLVPEVRLVDVGAVARRAEI